MSNHKQYQLKNMNFKRIIWYIKLIFFKTKKIQIIYLVINGLKNNL